MLPATLQRTTLPKFVTSVPGVLIDDVLLLALVATYSLEIGIMIQRPAVSLSHIVPLEPHISP